jgi:hypothetical protein
MRLDKLTAFLSAKTEAAEQLFPLEAASENP